MRRRQAGLEAYHAHNLGEKRRTRYVYLRFIKATRGSGSGCTPTEQRSQPLWWSVAFRRVQEIYFAKVDSASITISSESLLTKPEHEGSPEGTKTTIESWILRDRHYKLWTWRPVLLRALQTSPSDVLLLLRDDLQHNGELFPSIVVQDCLDHLALVYLSGEVSPSKTVLNVILCAACDFLESYARRLNSVSIHQRTIRLLSKHSDIQQLTMLLKTLQSTRVNVHTNTKLHIMPKLVEAGNIGSALSLLKNMPAEDKSTTKVQKFCVMLLRADIEVDDLYGLRSNILAHMLETGIRPNRIMADVIILNAMEGGDFDTAWRSHEIAWENGLEPDAGTYTALLKGIQHGDKRDAVRHVYELAKRDGFLARSSRLRSEMLFAMYLSENNKRQRKPYSTLLPRFQEFYDVQPLRELGIYYPPQSPIDASIQPIEPPRLALSLMILAWLQQHHSNRPVLEVYERYLRCTMNGHPIIAQLAETTHTSNAFVIAFGRSFHTLHMCTQVVQDMLKPKAAKLEGVQADNEDASTTHVCNIKPDMSASDFYEPDAQDHEYAVKDKEARITQVNAIEPYTSESESHDLGAQPHKATAEIPIIIDSESTSLVKWNVANRFVTVAPPDIYTWSILLFAFIRNCQATAAEKVLTIMEARGQIPNHVTWTSLLSGYSAMQDLSGVVSTLKRMDQAGFKDDEWTTKALARVVDRDALLRQFERSNRERREDVDEIS